MITPRQTRLLRVPDLRAMHRALASTLPRGAEARASAVIVPSRSAAEQLRRTLEHLLLGEACESACVWPDLLTRSDLYSRLHERLPDAAPLLSDFERDVLLRLAAEDAAAAGHAPPFRLRPGLLAAMLAFYDELRRRGRTIDSLDRHVRVPLEAGRDTDRGAARLLVQTEFLAATYSAFERRVADSGRLDEHALRILLLSSPPVPPYRHVVVTVADQAADALGLWPADFDVLARLGGLERLDVVATEGVLAAGWHERLHGALPGLAEARVESPSPMPALVAPEADAAAEPPAYFAARDREEELADAVRSIKADARKRGPDASRRLDRIAIVFQRPLPYLYLARPVFGSARVPYQALDALPLAAEPFAAAFDLVLTAALEDASRTAVVALLGSPHWRVEDPSRPGERLGRAVVAALDRVLRDAKYLGGWERLTELAARAEGIAAGGTRDAGRWRRALPALRAAGTIGAVLAPLREADSATVQISVLLDFIAHRGIAPDRDDPGAERHLRARAAVVGALTALREAHRRYDDRPIRPAELVATVRRWIEGQTFAPRVGRDGVLLLDAAAARYADVDVAWLVGLVESDWPERGTAGIFYPASLLRELGWAPEAERLAAARARFLDLLALPAQQVSVSSFTLEDDVLVAPSPLLEEVPHAGLAVRRGSVDRETRIFTHEALSTDPAALAAADGQAASWLDLRLSRTPSGAARYHGATGARPATTYAVSRVERYLACPFKYFAGHVLALEEEREDESGLTAQERGQLLHGVFQTFFEVWQQREGGAVTAANLGEAIDLFTEVAERELETLPEADRALERTYLLGSAATPGLAERAFAFEIEEGARVVERLLEHPLEGRFQFQGDAGPRAIDVRGKADRIDLRADGTLCLIDYKLGRAPKASRALQLPVYAVCAAQALDGRLGRRWSVGRAGYLAFREKNVFADLARGAGGLETALRDGETKFVEAIAAIEAGTFPPSPDEPWTCTRCGFPDVCRKDYVGDE